MFVMKADKYTCNDHDICILQDGYPVYIPKGKLGERVHTPIYTTFMMSTGLDKAYDEEYPKYPAMYMGEFVREVPIYDKRNRNYSVLGYTGLPRVFWM